MSKYITYKPSIDRMRENAFESGVDFQTYINAVDETLRKTRNCVLFDLPDGAIATLEYGYQKEKNMLFIEDQNTVDFLMNLKFKTKEGATIVPPFGSFTLSVPSGLKFNGVSIDPVLVYADETLMPDLSLEFKEYAQLKSHNVSDEILIESRKNACLFNFVFSVHPKSKDDKSLEKSIFSIRESSLIDLLNTDINDYDTARKIIENIAHPLSDYEVKQLLVTLRLIAALSVYNTATDGKHLRSGVPFGFSSKPKKLGLLKKEYSQLKFSSIKLKLPKCKIGETVVTGFMRNLQHEKYYRGKYAKLKPKSRWVEVEGWVTGEANPVTQET